MIYRGRISTARPADVYKAFGPRTPYEQLDRRRFKVSLFRGGG